MIEEKAAGANRAALEADYAELRQAALVLCCEVQKALTSKAGMAIDFPIERIEDVLKLAGNPRPKHMV